MEHGEMKSGAFTLIFILAMLSQAGGAGAMEEGQTLTTFDPYGDAGGTAVSEARARRKLAHMWTALYTYGFVYRTRLLKDGEVLDRTFERNHTHTFGLDFRPSKYFFVGASLPVVIAHFERKDAPKSKYEYDETGLGDIATYVGTTLPWIPLSLTAVLMLPTGDYEKGMGTGEIGGGLNADLRWSLGRVDTNLCGFYFFVANPETKAGEAQVELPDVYGASVKAATQVTSWLRPGLGFEWTHSMIITMDEINILKLSAKVTWRITRRIFAVTGFAMEIYPVSAYNPSLSLIFSI